MQDASKRERMAYGWLEDVASCQGIVSLSTGEAEKLNFYGIRQRPWEGMWIPNTTGDKGVLATGF